MTTSEKLRRKILAGSKSGIRFTDVCTFLEQHGFEGRQKKTSHRSYRIESVPAAYINVQRQKDGTVLPYQIAQIRNIFQRYDL